MREIVQTSQFKTDLKKIARSGRHKKADLLSVIEDLANDVPLAQNLWDYPLTGNWAHYRECHIKPDWLLIYKLEPGILRLVRTGSHSELF